MKFFDDYELNRRANKINELYEEITLPMTAMSIGFSNQVDIPNPEKAADKISEIMEDGMGVAELFLDNTLNDLHYIKSVVGSQNKTYIELTEKIVVASSSVVKFKLSSINRLTMIKGFSSDKSLVEQVKYELAKGTRLLEIISNMDMSSRARTEINKIIDLINVAEKKVNINSGCYIATCVYGSYNSVEVMTLRSFRDNILSKFYLGKKFISFYYLISPKIVKKFGENYVMKSVMKNVLDKVIVLIK